MTSIIITAGLGFAIGISLIRDTAAVNLFLLITGG